MVIIIGRQSKEDRAIYVCGIGNRAGYSLIGFLSESLFFAKQLANEQFAQKNERFAHVLIFGE